MEPALLSGPLGHTQWEPEQPFPFGFLALDSDNGGVLCQNKSGQTGLDFRNGGLDLNLHQKPENQPVEVEDHVNITSNYFCEDLLFEAGLPSFHQAPLTGTHFKELPSTGKTELLDENSDFTLSWLFSPDQVDIKTNFVFEELTSSKLDLLSETASLSKRNSVKHPGDPELLPNSPSDEQSNSTTEVADISNPLGVTEELMIPSQLERAGRPPSHDCETLSPETGERGLFHDQVTDLPVTNRLALPGLQDSSLQHNHISEQQQDCCEVSVPLLDLDFTDCDSGVSLCPDHSVNGTDLDFSTELELTGPTVISKQTLPQQGANDSSLLYLPVEPPSLTEDAFILPEATCSAVEQKASVLMEDKDHIQEHEVMAFDQCSVSDELHDEGPWDLKSLERSQNDAVSESATEQWRAKSLTNVALIGEVASLESSLQELNTSSYEDRWTKEATEEPSSHRVGDDSLPMVSPVSPGEVSPLKPVFDALDQDGDGFVRVEEFMKFAAAYGADQVKDITKFLDPSGLGVISFEDFHRGISAISNGGLEPQLYNVNYSPADGAVGCVEEYDEQNEVTDSAYLGSESTYSECETFTDEDTGALVAPEMHEDVDADSGIEATLHDPEDGLNRFSLNSDLHNHSLVTVIGGEEEHFEDFGESNTSELLESSVDGTDGVDDSTLSPPPKQVNGSSLLSPSAPAPLPDCFQSFLREEALDFFCSQCHKQISRLEDLSTRLNFLEMTSAGKRLSSKKVARHLLQNSSMTLDTMSDLTRDILELADNDITDKVLLLERRVAELEKESEASGEQHARLRQENLQLVHRANAFEEQLKEQELHADERLQQETRRHKEALSKLERDTGMEMENMQTRLQQLDEENCELRSCVPCLRANIERVEEEKRKLLDEVETMSERLSEEMESRQKMADKLSHERHQSQKEKESTQELIEDLRKQLEHLQLYKLEAEAKRGRLPGAGLQEYQTRTREAELEQEIKRLKQDNRSLKEQNDELNGQIINLSIQGAKNLMSASFSDSLAAEISSVSRTELMETVHKQEEINYRLQDYIDKIIVAIMECNPSILEVK
ncbi:rab11 family-interacting protein 3 isoform X1 [Synchiropus splendidus]|uniref:rab11 family-interacting protein 3 isoform X1 n=1 Tax=Synchiropus splendidus TaxID=270530 RepID=UPI00237D4476|nr:rab11 family-interacting protein 3 isoform X1 [Synchiropus splendidus]